jgi:hypothetical protein
VAEVTISRDVIDRAARALVASNTLTYKTWDEMNEGQRRLWRQRAEVVLNAGAPLVEAAVLDRVKAEVESLAAQRDAIGDDDYEPDEDNCDDAGECHTAGALASYARVISLLSKHSAELRAQS